MANSPKGSGNPLLPIAIIAVVVLAVLVGVFALSGEEPPDRETIIADDRAEGVLGGTGSVPEGEAADAVGQAEPDRGADEYREGVTDQLDEVEPAADGVDSVPAADRIDASGGDAEGESASASQTAGAANGGSAEGSEDDEQPDVQPVGTTTIDAAQAGGANAELSDDGDASRQQSDAPAASIVGDPSAAGDPLIDDETVGTEGAENVDTPATSDTATAQAYPDGRDAQVNLNPSECQDIVRDTDTGGAAFIPTPSGPDGNNRGECLDDPEQ